MDDSSSAVDPGIAQYPEELQRAELKFLEARRGAVGLDQAGKLVGVGISGGGIRSATFALGFFQALVQAGRTKQIDYLSTVSGGGYFGGFFGALFRRDYVRSHADLERILEPRKPTEVLRYLRENGSYLAPAGTDSLLLGAATLFRNWCVIQLLFLMSLFGGFLFVQAATAWLLLNPHLTNAAKSFPLWRALAAYGIAVSPWLALGAVMSAFWVVPLTWSYWAIGRDVPLRQRGVVRAFVKLIWTVLLYVPPAGCGLFIALRVPESSEIGWMIAGVAGVALSTGLMALVGIARGAFVFSLVAAAAPVVICALGGAASLSWVPAIGIISAGLALWMFGAEVAQSRKFAAAVDGRGPGSDELDEDNEGRYELSAALKTALVATSVVIALGLIDTAARSLSIPVLGDQPLADALAKRGIGFGTFIAIAASILRRAWALFSQPPGKGERPGLPMTLVAGIAAVLTVIAILLVCDAGAFAAVSGLQSADGASFAVACGTALGAVLIANMILGSSRNLLNASTQLPLYSARLIRAYLGASNKRRLPDAPPFTSEPVVDARTPANDTLPEVAPERRKTEPPARDRRIEVSAGKPSRLAATRVMKDDDLPAQTYWCWDNGARNPDGAKHQSPYAKGAPLHLVNVTINETVDGRSQIQQGDRKGVGLAVGPGGFSAGVRHHAVFRDGRCEAFPTDGWQVFRFEDEPTRALNWRQKLRRALSPSYWIDLSHTSKTFPLDQLSFGQWLGISGAAFSTGLGSRTNLGLSVLAALANVRLGFWWRPGIKTVVSWFHRVGVLFWVQSYLFRELLARFPGTSRALWYLSDGGHFENLGGYELIRRRLPQILIVDSEEDADYACEGLANLVRKARLDFGAEIEFLDTQAYADNGSWPHFTGSLNDLQRGEWTQAKDTHEWSLNTASQAGLSRVHAALARISYRDQPEKGWLLYVKPTLIGDESQDLRNYHATHPAFPHEPTSDQFFDESQWESYRYLGQRIAERLLEKDGALQLFFDQNLREPDGTQVRVSSIPAADRATGSG